MIGVGVCFFCVMVGYSNLVGLGGLRVILLDFGLKESLVFGCLGEWM